MFGRILDLTPGVGHVKGIVHYVKGDTTAGDEAMAKATKSTVIVAAGAAGLAGGPIIVGAGGAGVIGAGAASATVAAAIAIAPPVFRGISKIASDISDGKVPLGSVARTGLIGGSDIIGKLGAVSNSLCATNSTGASVSKSAEKVIQLTR